MASVAAPSHAQPQAGLKERFFRYFQHEVTALQDQMARLPLTSSSGGERADAVDHCLAGISRLSAEVKDASSYIPAYDQRTYSEAIKALSEKLQKIRNSFDPPKKFKFGTQRKNASAISLADAAELAQAGGLKVGGRGGPSGGSSNVGSSFAPTPLEKMSPTEEKRELDLLGQADGQEAGGQPVISKEKGVLISNHTGSHIILPSSAARSTSSGTVSNLRRSVVDLSPPTTNGGPFANLTLKNVKGSLIVCGQTAGPIHITGVENSVLVTACRQFRMHSSRNVDVYLHSSSRPIIEDCEGIRFAPLPSTYITEDMSTSSNQWDQIDDFKWLKAEPSPHFSILPAGEHVKEEVWRDTVPGGHDVSLGDILQAVKVPQ